MGKKTKNKKYEPKKNKIQISVAHDCYYITSIVHALLHADRSLLQGSSKKGELLENLEKKKAAAAPRGRPALVSGDEQLRRHHSPGPTVLCFDPQRPST